MSNIFPYFILLTIVSFFFTKFSIILLKNLKYYSLPTKRGLHVNSTVTSGGIIFLCYLLFLVFIYKNEKIIEINNLFFFSILLFTIIFGLFDDKINIKSSKKIIIQLIIAIILIFFYEFSLFQKLFLLTDNFYICLFLNILFIVAFINFINFIDGADGNLSLFAFFIFNFLLIKFIFTSSNVEINHIIYFLPFLISFYFFNIQKKLFLGESGSFFLSIFLILNLNFYVGETLIVLTDILIISSYFIIDMVLTFFLRLYKFGIEGFKAHRDHAYQNFCLIKKNHKILNIVMFVFHFVYIFPLYILSLKNYISLYLVLVLCMLPSLIFVIKFSPLLKNYEK